MNLPEKEVRVEHKKISAIAFIILFIAIIGLAFFVYLKSQSMEVENLNLKQLFMSTYRPEEGGETAKVITELQLEPKNPASFGMYKGNLILCTKDIITSYNKKGEIQWSIKAALHAPMIKSNETGLLIADVQGNVYVINGKSIQWELKLENKIINVDINEEGYVSIIHEAKGYRGAVSVYNPQGSKIFTRYIGTNYALHAKISPSGKAVMIDTIDASGATVTGVLEFVDMNGKPIAQVEKKENLLASVSYFRDGSIIAISDNALIYYDKDRNEKWTQLFTNKKLFGFDTVLNKYAVIAVSAQDAKGIINGNKTSVQLWNASKKKIWENTLDGIVKSIEVYSDAIALNLGREVDFINGNGKLAGKFFSKQEITGLHFLDKQTLAVVTRDRVTIVKAN